MLFTESGARLVPETELPRRNGAMLWAVTVPANGRATLHYRVEKP